VQQRRILDDSARKRRQRRALEALEEDNFQEDPHADLKMNKRAPKFEESVDSCKYHFKNVYY
jgi:zinc finger HIT domain-containing protein 1